jgi:hypothetical protein
MSSPRRTEQTFDLWRRDVLADILGSALDGAKNGAIIGAIAGLALWIVLQLSKKFKK